MNNLKENKNGIVICLFEIFVGILLLVNPVGFTSGIIIGTGIVLSVFGLISIFKYFGTNIEEASRNQDLSKGLVALFGGLFCIFKSEWFAIAFPVLTILYGVFMILSGIGKVQWAIDLLRLKRKWILPAVSALLSLVFGFVILQSPFETTAILWMFTGITMIVEAVFDAFSLVYVGKNGFKASYVEVENVPEIEEKSK
ncbi:MAG: DUF308 domain-containing protein [Agathobacter sp.]|nr:DUF308 domain-containing protein [Agathobacter sp.]